MIATSHPHLLAYLQDAMDDMRDSQRNRFLVKVFAYLVATTVAWAQIMDLAVRTLVLGGLSESSLGPLEQRMQADQRDLKELRFSFQGCDKQWPQLSDAEKDQAATTLVERSISSLEKLRELSKHPCIDSYIHL